MKEKNQRIFCVFSLRNYSDVFDQKNVMYIIGSFWKLVKVMFSNKFINEQNITFVENQNILTKEIDTTRALNDFYVFLVFNKK